MNRRIKLVKMICLLSIILMTCYAYFVSSIPSLKKIGCGKAAAEQISNLKNKLMSCYEDRDKRTWISLFRDPQNRGLDVLKINQEGFSNGARLYYFSRSATSLGVKIGTEKNWHYQNLGSTSYATRVLSSADFTQSDLDAGILIRPYPSNGSIFVRISSQNIDKTSPLAPVAKADGSRSLFLAFTMLVFIFMGSSFWIYHYTSKPQWGVLFLSGVFILAVFNFERPYRGMSGFLSQADDTYYTAYAINHIAKGNIFDCGTYVPFSRKKNVPCYGLPGTALMLEPGIFVMASLTNTKVYGGFNLNKLRAMRSMSALYGLLSMIMMFMALHVIKASSFNLTLASTLLIGTSLAKWAFVRSIFTHSPEIFLSTCFVFFFALWSKRKIKTYMFSFLAAMILGIVIFVRGEYLIAGAALPFFLMPWGKLKKPKEYVPISIYLTFFAISVFFYRYVTAHTSGYGTGTGTRLIISSFGDLFGFEFYERFGTHAKMVLESFYYSGGFPFIGLFSLGVILYKQAHLDRFICFCIFFIISYFILTTLFVSPLGLEWQHRYYLKLYPYFMVLTALAYHKFRNRVIQIGFFLAILFSTTINFSTLENYYKGTGIIYYERMKFVLTNEQILTRGWDPGYYQNALVGFATILFLSSTVIIYEGARWFSLTLIKPKAS